MRFSRLTRSAFVATAFSILSFSGSQAEDAIQPDPVEELRLFSQDLWPRFRGTNQQYYTYVRAAADFRAYLEVCKRHDLNVHLVPVNKLAARYLREIITAHYEEGEWAKLDGKSDAEKAAITADFANDVLALEYAFSLTEFRDRAKVTNLTSKQYCETVVREYQAKYISLLATARHQAEER